MIENQFTIENIASYWELLLLSSLFFTLLVYFFKGK